MQKQGSGISASETAAERRRKIARILENQNGTDGAVSASALAAKFHVSRQVIVGDIALLRSGGLAVDATPRGYLLHRDEKGILRQIVCCHDAERMEEELRTMVDFGCTVCDVRVDHPVYGTLTGALKLSSRYDVELFADRVREAEALPLSALTEGVHTHTLLCPSDELFEKLHARLSEMGICCV